MVVVFGFWLALTAYAEPVGSLHPTGYVNDFAQAIRPETLAQMESLCLQTDRQAHAQIAVVTINTLDGSDIESYAVEPLQELGDRRQVNQSWRSDPLCHPGSAGPH